MTGSAAKRCTFCCRAIALKWEGVPGEGWRPVEPDRRPADLFLGILGAVFQGYFWYPFCVPFLVTRATKKEYSGELGS